MLVAVWPAIARSRSPTPLGEGALFFSASLSAGRDGASIIRKACRWEASWETRKFYTG
jgi:hypothetical protein